MKSRPRPSSVHTATADTGVTQSSSRQRRLHRAAPAPMALEQRIMFDGAAVDTALAAHRAIEPVKDTTAAAATSAASAERTASQATIDKAVPAASAAAMDNAATRHEIVFIEDNVANFQQLVAGVKAGVEVVVLDHTRDGLQQMSEVLKSHAPVDAIHLFTHGTDGQINLGTTYLSSDNLDQYRDQLTTIGQAMTAHGDLLIYGCDIAQDDAGRAFVDKIATATGADIAASVDATGAAVLGGNWDLEYIHGQIETATIQETQYTGLMANAVTSISTIAGDGIVSASEKTSVTISGALNNSSGAVRVTVTDGSVSVSTTATVSGGSTFATSAMDLSALKEGSLTVYVKEFNNTTNADSAGNLTAGDVSTTITKDTVAPTFSTATVNGTQLVLTYADTNNLDATNIPATSAFSVMANGSSVAVSSVAVSASGKTVTLTLGSAVSSGQSVTVAYTDPTAGNDTAAIQDVAGNDAATLSATTVTNNTTGVANAAPTLSLAKTTVSYNGTSISLGTMNATEIADSDSTAFSNLKVNFSPSADAASETLGGIALNKTTGTGTITLNGVTYNYSVSSSGSTTFTFTRSSGNFSTTEVEALLDQLKYSTSKSTPTAGSRIFGITVTDSGSATSSTATKTITVPNSAIDLTSSSGWTAILRGDNYDYNDDTQANASKGLDLVGNASNPLLYSQYNAMSGELAFRIREETAGVSGVFYLLGVIGTPASSKVDFFIGVYIPSGAGPRTVMFYDPGSDANISPSTSSFNTKTAVAPSSYAVAITSTGSDLDANGATDGFVNFKFSAADLVTYANSRISGGYTIDKSVAFVLLTATQNNSINGDIGGIRGTSSQTYADLGIATPVVFSNTPPTGANDTATIAEDSQYVFNTTNDFPFSDSDLNDTLSGVRITSLPAAGTLQYDTTGTGNWTTVSLYQTISTSDINTGRLRFVPGADGNGAPYASFQFQVSDGKTLSADNYTFTLNVTAINDAPVISRLSGDITYWTTANTPVAIDALPAAIVGDVDSPDFNGGALTLHVSGGNDADNALSLVAGGSVTVSGTNVLVNGQVIGQLSGAGTGTLTLSFQSAYATPDAVTQVLGAVRFTYGGNETMPALRTLTASVTDGDGGTSNTASVTLVGPPVYNVYGTEDLAQAFAAADYQIGTTSPGTVKMTELALGGGTLTFTRNGSTVTLTNATDLSALAALSTAEFNTLVYHPAADAYGDGIARLRFKYVDASSAGNGQYDAQGLSLINPTVIINLAAVNDPPVVDLNGPGNAGTAYTTTFTEIDGPDESWNDVALVASGTVNLSDVDSTAFSSLTVSGAVSAGDQIVIGATAIDLTASGSGTVTVSGTRFGYTVSNTAGNAVLSLSSQSNGAATPAAITTYEALLDSLRYNNASDTPQAGTRNFAIRVNDGQADSVAATASVTVVPTNDTPALGGVSQTAQYDYSRDTPVSIFPSITLSDRDDKIQSVTLTINNPVAGDTLSFAGSANIAAVSATYSSGSTLTLTLTGTGSWTTAEMQSAVRSVTFSNTTTATAGANRLIDVQATDNGAVSPVKSSSVGTVSVSLVNGTPGIDLISASDSGASSTDNYTNVTTPTFAIAIPSTATSGQIVYLYDGQATDSLPFGNLMASTTLTQSGAQTVNLTVSSALPDGVYTFYTCVDSGQTAQLDVTIDHTSPAVAITGITDDTGTAGDFITRDTQLIFSGTAEASSTVTVTLTDAGSQQVFQTTVNADDTTGAWSVDRTAFSALADGSYTLTASAKDIAGNTATASKTVKIDTSATITIGTIAGDDRINGAEDDSAVTIGGSTTGVESGQTVTLSLGGKTYTGTVGADGSWSTSVSAADAQALPASNTVSVSVTDVAGNVATGTRAVSHDGAAPTVLAGQTFSYAENRTTGTAIGTVVANDNTGVTGYRFVYANGTTTSAVSEDGYYTIGSDGTLTLTAAGAAAQAASNDYETAPNSFTYQIQASDLAGNWSAAQSIQTAVTNMDEVAPAFTSQPSANAAESQNLLYTASATDNVDFTNKAVTYSLKANNNDDAGLLVIDSTTGKVTLGTGNLDYESGTTSYAFTVIAKDASNNAREQAVTVAVTNIDEVAPAFTSAASVNAAENQNVLYTASATDNVDFTDKVVTYSLKANNNDDAALLVIDSATGKVTLASGNLNYAAKPNYVFTVIAKDQTQNATEQTVTTTVIDPGVSNQPPVSVTVDNGVTTIAENTTIGSGIKVGDIAISDDGVGTNTLSLSGPDAANFAIRNGNELYYVGAVPDYEGKTSYSVSILVDDTSVGSTPDASHTFTLNVTNVDEVAPAFTSPNAVSVAENQNVLYTAATTDNIDFTDKVVTYSLKANNNDDAGLLAIDGATGKVTLASGNLDYESGKTSYAFTVVAKDASGNASEQIVTVNVANVDEVAPAFTSTATGNAAENQNVLYSAAATDNVDFTDKAVTYSLKADNNDDAALLAIDPATGKVTLALGNLDYESGKTSYAFTVVAKDASNNVREQAVTIAVTNVDEVAPAFISATTGSVAENQNALYTASATDNVDFTDKAVTYSLKANNNDDAALLSIDAATGKVTLASGNLDYESGKTSYAFTVVAKDASNNSREQAVTVSVANVDEVAPDFISATTGSAAEGQNVLYTASATDNVDFTDKVVAYSLKANNNDDAGLLSIDPTTGKISLIDGNLDAESAKTSYTFTVIAADAGHNTREQTVTIAVENTDEVAPAFTSGTTDSAAENQNALYTAAATDNVDFTDKVVTYSLMANNNDDAALLVIDGTTGKVTLASGNLDYESGKTSYVFTVVANDASGNASEQTVTVNVANVDEVAPGFTSTATGNAVENQNVLYTAAATDNVDFTDKVVTYSLKANNNDDAGLLAIDATTGKVTLVSGNLDYESGKTSYAFTIVAKDASNNAREQAVTISLANTDEVAPAFASATTGSAAENQNVLYTAAATDNVDFTDKVVTYSLKANNNDDAGLLAIDGATGKVTLASGNLDYESSKTSYAFTVVAKDASGNVNEQIVTVNVANVDEVAPAFTSTATGNAAENQNVLYTAAATDNVDFTDKAVTYSLKTNNGDDAALLAIDPATGKITLTSDNLDYESGKTSYAFTVVAKDASNNVREQAVTIAVTNVDEVAPAFISATTGSVAENQNALYTASATDNVDFTDKAVTYNLKANNNDDAALLSIDAATGKVTLASGNLDYESGKTSYAFTVIASDASGNQREQQITVAVTDGNDQPIGSDVSVSTVQNNPVQGKLPDAVDQDGDKLVYAAETGPAHGALVLQQDGSYSYVPADGYAGSDSFTYRVSDGKGGSNVYTVAINVKPNAAPTASDADIVTDEDTAVRGQLPVATDADNDAVVYAGADAPSHGTVVIADDGSFTYRPEKDFNGADVFTYRVSDANGASSVHTVHVNVVPVNDPASIDGQLAGDVTEDRVLIASGTARVTDVDTGEAKFLATSSQGTYGTFVIDAGGAWKYALDNGNAKVQALVTGQTVNDTFVIKSADGTTSSVVIAIHGTDEPVVTVANPDTFVGPQRPVNQPVITPPATQPVTPVTAFVGPDPRDARPVTVSFQDTRSVTASVVAAPGSVVGDDASRAGIGRLGTKFDMLDVQGLRNNAELSDVYTRSEGFRTVVARADEPALVLFRGVPDQYTESGSHLSLTVPADAFVHTQPKEVVRLSASLQDGRPLPTWAQFNAQTGQFTGEVPPGLRGELRIKVVARDMQGREATALFRVNIGSVSPGDGGKNSGKIGLSEQLKQSALGGRRLDKLSTNGRTPPARGTRLG